MTAWRLEEVALGVTPVETRRNHGMAKAKCGRLKDMTNARVDVGVITTIRRHWLVKERLQVLVQDYVL